MMTADGVAFISEQAGKQRGLRDCYRQGLPTAVVHCGADAEKETRRHQSAHGHGRRRRVILCLGASYLHKNRVFGSNLPPVAGSWMDGPTGLVGSHTSETATPSPRRRNGPSAMPGCVMGS